MERNRSPWIVPYLMGYIVGSVTQLAFRAASENDTVPVEQIEQVQTYGYQIADELSTQFESIEDLRLTVNGQDFEFNSTGRSCSGEYEVTNEVAMITGDITCSQTIETNN